MIRAAISFGSDTAQGGQRVVGRRVANSAFLRAAVNGREGGPVVGYGNEAHTGADFAAAVAEIDPLAPTEWLLNDELGKLVAQKVLHRLDPHIRKEAFARAWAGPHRYSLTAVTHTLFSVQPEVAAWLREPVMPWDALVCTSHAGRSVVAAVLEAEADYARWRYGAATVPAFPQLPVIPLGVHAEDFSFGPDERRRARAALGVADDEVVALFAGRLSVLSKAHPGQMYQGLEAVAATSGARLVLVECGRVGGGEDRGAFANGAARLAPSVRSLPLDGGEPQQYRNAWAGADLFISLADNIQETFGLTPLEAMAAGLPVIVSDWDGYRDTVRDGIDGFRIPTWAPAPGLGTHLALPHQARTITDNMLSWGAAAATSVDADVLVQRIGELVADPALRAAMGRSGRERARTTFDWRGVYREYQALWADLDERRLRDSVAGIPARSGAQLEPFTAFAGYPTRAISGTTLAALRPGARIADYRELARHPLYPAGAATPPAAEPLWGVLEQGGATLQAAADALGLPLKPVVLAAGVLAKLGFVRLSSAD